jgi:transcriptional regulator with XRE-family HTH domain
MMKVYLKSHECKEILMKRNLSQNWLAMKLDISTGYMSQLMSGERRPSPSLRQRILNLFVSCNFDDLFEIRNE